MGGSKNMPKWGDDKESRFRQVGRVLYAPSTQPEYMDRLPFLSDNEAQKGPPPVKPVKPVKPDAPAVKQEEWNTMEAAKRRTGRRSTILANGGTSGRPQEGRTILGG
jgi:hypothetical protein